MNHKTTLPRVVFVAALAVGTASELVGSAAPQSTAASARTEIDDTTITAAISRALQRSDYVQASNVVATTAKGIVTLTGTVSDLRARRRAVELATAVRGVRSVVDDLVVKPVRRPEKVIEMDVDLSLVENPATEAFEIEADAIGSKVVLTGKVDSIQEKRLAGRVAADVQGVSAVDNRLQVSYDTHRSDREILHDVEGHLAADAHVDSTYISARVHGGKVALAGSVGSEAERRRAILDAFVLGAHAVTADQLRVAPIARDPMKRHRQPVKTDAQIADALHLALRYEPLVNADAVQLTVDAGMVRLHGTVDSLQAKRAAEHTARNTTGVTLVRNMIRVRPSETVDDAEVAERVKRALERDPTLSGYDLKVVVLDGLVYLAGKVNSQAHRTLATRVVAATHGVAAVQNNVSVDRPTPDVTSDRDLRREIDSALFWNPYVDQHDVEVEVVGGVATLSGTVDSLVEREEAEQAARRAGAWKVNDHLLLEAWK